MPRSCWLPGRPCPPPRSPRSPANGWPATRCRGRWRSPASCPGPARASCSSANCARPTGPGTPGRSAEHGPAVGRLAAPDRANHGAVAVRIASREFVLAGHAPGAGVWQAGEPGLRITPGGRARTVRRAWLDTFDWRLFRAGLTLELRAPGRPAGRGGRAGAVLVLTGRDGRAVTGEAGPAARPPFLAGALPDGPLRARLAAAAGVRALLPLAEATSVVTEARSELTAPSRAALPARLVIGPLRGYQAEADRLAAALAGAPGVEPAAGSAFETALAAAGRRPGDCSGRADVRLSAGMPAAAAVAVILLSLLDAAEANVPGTLRDLDTEFLHDLRVAVRRTRSVLRAAGAALPPGLADRYRAEFKWLGDLTTPVRDLDVYLLGYPAMAAGLVAAAPADLEPFRERLRQRRARARGRLVRGLRSERFADLAAGWRRDLAGLAGASGGPSAGELAAGQIARAHRRALLLGGSIGPGSPPQALHELRKACKELRYLLEAFASLHDPARQRRAVRELRALQDCLGRVQDAEVQLAVLREIAGQLHADGSAPAAALLAMGEAAGAVAARQAAARGEFAERFAGFASPGGRARIRALTRGAR